jgi:alpha-N-arabinofuranosidase
MIPYAALLFQVIVSLSTAPVAAAAEVGKAVPTPSSGLHARITFSSSDTGAPVNRLVAGSNVQWVDRGDELLRGESVEFSAGLLASVKEMAPTILRYPGGSQSDTYHWRDGLGGAGDRKSGEHFFSKQKQKVWFGTAELLRLCQEVGGQPLLTVNAATGTPEEAAEWVTYVNKARVKDDAGHVYPAVTYWEIGNEPYLKDVRPDLAMPPAEFARRAGKLIAAMKKADPSIQVGLPLRSDRIGTTPATPYQGYNDAVLKGVGADYDFVALHDAYMPFLLGPPPAKDVMFGAAMAADTIIEEDFAFTRGLLERARPGRKTPLAITEYNAVYTLSGAPTDRYTATLTAALFTADVLRLLAEREDILCANHWSLSGNGFFGALSRTGHRRPSFYVLRGFSRLSKGRRVTLATDSPVHDTPAAGLVPARKGRPVITAFAAREGQTLRLMIVNKDVASPALVTLTVSDKKAPTITRATQGEVWTEDYFADGDSVDAWSERPLAARAWPLTVELKPHSVSFMEIELESPKVAPVKKATPTRVRKRA